MKIKIFPPSENVKYLKKKIHGLFQGLDLFQLFSSPLWCVKKRDAREIRLLTNMCTYHLIEGVLQFSLFGITTTFLQ